MAEVPFGTPCALIPGLIKAIGLQVDAFCLGLVTVKSFTTGMDGGTYQAISIFFYSSKVRPTTFIYELTKPKLK